MVALKKIVLKKSIQWHQWFGWTGGLALLIFALSGLSHILMSWTGPKATAFYPPQAVMKTTYITAIPAILEKHGIKKTIVVKIVPAENGPVLQVTEHNDRPRRYFDLSSYEEIQGYDKQQALWLARYYTGLQKKDIQEVTFQTEFDAAYP